MPRALVAGQGLPENVLTDERTVNLRHSDWSTNALLIANTDDDQGTYLQDVTLLGAKLLTGEPSLWVQAANAGLDLPDNQLEIWKTALAGLASAEDWSLQQMANYVASTRSRIRDESKPLIEALGCP
jgi:S-DNA-T family DNA segregation ATPase FtsK/SpoIIIE